MKKQFPKICKRCSKEFIPTGLNHKFCGSSKLKTGCSYENDKEVSKIYHIKHPEKRTHGIRPKVKILDKLGHKCSKCGIFSEIKGFFDIDHIIPVRRKLIRYNSDTSITHGEANRTDLKNVYQVLCPNCHRLKTLQDRITYSFGKKS